VNEGNGEAVAAAATYIRARWRRAPQVGLILGTGLGALASRLDPQVVIPYREIPHFPCSTALSHKGQLRLGTLAGANVMVMEGRCHAYEGYSMAQIALPVRTMHALGAGALIATCASGGLHGKLQAGDVVIIDDHLNWTRQSPLAGAVEHGKRAAARRPVYDRELIERAKGIARENDFDAPLGVYAAMTGPNYETRAEYRLLRKIGADVVGMSTMPEATVAAWLGMRVLGLTAVTNVARPDAPHRVCAEDVVRSAEQSEPKISQIVCGILAAL
jgi:purine-nucleoside phosphorylase